MSETNPTGMDLIVDEGFVLSTGICHMVVCVPKSWSNERILAFVGPSGTSGGWQLAESDPEVCNGDVRCQCPDDDGREHVLLDC